MAKFSSDGNMLLVCLLDRFLKILLWLVRTILSQSVWLLEKIKISTILLPALEISFSEILSFQLENLYLLSNIEKISDSWYYLMVNWVFKKILIQWRPQPIRSPLSAYQLIRDRAESIYLKVHLSKQFCSETCRKLPTLKWP